LCLAESRIHVEAVNMGIITHPIKASSYFHPFSTIRLSLLLRKNDYSLIHTQASKDLWILVPALKLAQSKIPLFFTKRVGSYIIKKDLLHHLLYKRVNKAFAISEVIRRNLLDTCPLKPEVVEILHNGVDMSRFNPETVDRNKIRTEFGIKENELVIGMVSRFTPGKGHEEFLWAAKELNKEFSNLKYLIVGEASRGEDQYAEKVKQLAREYDLNNVIFTGYRGDIPNVLAAINIFIFPSHAEALGNALIEAMAMKLPSVCSNAEGVLDIAVDNETSYLFENKNAEDLKEKIKLLIESEALRRQFGENAGKRVLENFEVGKVTDKIIKMYEEEINKVQRKK
jgi:glycosyltransferase involved in cell wall biosynthesis